MNILFMCVANSARSQMAEGIAKALFSGCKIESAGSHPSSVNPFAIQAMKEIGIDISGHFSKSIDQLSPEFLTQLNFVITLCAEEVCPVLPSQAKTLHWPLPDPVSKETLSEDQSLRRFKDTRDILLSKLKAFRPDLF